MQSKTKTNAVAPFRTPLIGLIAVGFISGFFLISAFAVFKADFEMAGIVLGVLLIFISITALLIGARIYAHIGLTLAQNEQKHLQNALVQAKDMLDTSKQLRDDHVLLQSMVQNLPFPVWLKDRFGRYLVFNQAFVNKWCSGVDPKGKTDQELLNTKLHEAFYAADEAALSTLTPQRLELRLDFEDLPAQWVRIERYALLGEDKQPVGILGYAFDISSYKSESISQGELLRDPLTSFANQTGLSKFSDQADDCGKAWCVQIDLDHFKVLNDSLGQDCGDQLLVQVAERIQSFCENDDFAARPNGDEFVLFWLDDDEEKKHQRLVNLHEQIKLPISISGTQYSFTSSIGAAKAPVHGQTYKALRQNAGVALFNAKKLGRNQIHWYQDTYQDQASRRLNKEQRLRQAIQDQRLEVHCQPRINCRTSEVEALEYLVRIKLNDEELLYPDGFIDLAEQNGLICKIDDFMLDQALNQINDWIQEGLEPITIAVNLSAQSINSALIDKLTQWQSRNPTVFDFLEIELTEHSLPDNDSTFLSLLNTIRTFDVRLSLDDFGTGYANLSRLPDWPFQILKMDRSFIIDLPNSEKQQAVVKSVIDLCSMLDIKVVAEGVETEEELTLIDRLGCHSIQGFVYAKPSLMTHACLWLKNKKLEEQ